MNLTFFITSKWNCEIVLPTMISKSHFTQKWSHHCFTDVCASFPCLNGGTCYDSRIVDGVGYGCQCPQGFMGQRCEIGDTGMWKLKEALDKFNTSKQCFLECPNCFPCDCWTGPIDDSWPFLIPAYPSSDNGGCEKGWIVWLTKSCLTRDLYFNKAISLDTRSIHSICTST